MVNEMFSNSYDICDILENTEFSLNLDIIKVLKDLFDKNPPIGEFNKKQNEFLLKITYENNVRNTFVLNKHKCQDNEFIKRNIIKKLDQNKIEVIKKFKDFFVEYKKMDEDIKIIKDKLGIEIDIDKDLLDINFLRKVFFKLNNAKYK